MSCLALCVSSHHHTRKLKWSDRQRSLLDLTGLNQTRSALALSSFLKHVGVLTGMHAGFVCQRGDPETHV